MVESPLGFFTQPKLKRHHGVQSSIALLSNEFLKPAKLRIDTLESGFFIGIAIKPISKRSARLIDRHLDETDQSVELSLCEELKKHSSSNIELAQLRRTPSFS
jgi:hypothetical protein